MIRCAECGHSMVHHGNGFYNCIENTCSIGLAVLGDFHSAERLRTRPGQFDRKQWVAFGGGR